MPFSFTFVVRQTMLLISNSLRRIRHFCFDANPYAIGRRGLRRNRNVWRAASSDLSHFELESTPPPEKQDAQTVDNQRNVRVLFLGSLPPAGRGWSANNSLQPTPVGRFSSAFAVDITVPAWLSSGR
jgi:hypothetical protein